MTTQLDFFGKAYSDRKQVDLFIKGLPSVEPHPPAAPASCRECGDTLPPKAKVCPNCYTSRARGGDTP